MHTKTQLNRPDNTTRHFLQLFCETAPDSFSGVSQSTLQLETFFYNFFLQKICILTCVYCYAVQLDNEKLNLACQFKAFTMV